MNVAFLADRDYLDPMTPGQRFAQARKALGIRQYQLARILGVTQTFIWKIESDQASFPADRLKDLPPEMRGVVTRELIAQINRQVAALVKRREVLEQ